MVETLGYTEEELLMHPFLDFVHADDKENTQKEIETIREGSQTLEFKNRWICNSIKWLVWSAIAEPQLVSCTPSRDITELVKLERTKKTIDALYQNEEKLRLILENISEGIIVANADKKLF
jgi:PAS domain S-box-containing protein